MYYCQSTAPHRTVMSLVANFDLADGNALSEQWRSIPLIATRQSTKEMAGISLCTLVPLFIANMSRDYDFDMMHSLLPSGRDHTYHTSSRNWAELP
ncbi:uncharacterized protein EAF01_003349 [Botrytis porri]|uniref:uncharacterized protein n=1 Tax=Botrytis porri TaxID=87229 RepID=UPI001901206C|nr:uncharacterized protein EAF01_003349 [Botrytis porri]KAF7909631.1 hypothetical protein EAF01_003349 [Botrytis porri]